MHRLFLLALLLVAACAPEKASEQAGKQVPEQASGKEAPEEKARYTRVSFDDLPGWQEDHPSLALPALRRSCALVLRRPDGRRIRPEGVGGSVADWRGPCEALLQLPETGRTAADDARLREVLKSRFDVYRVTTGAGAGLFTGYFEPELNGTAERRPGYETPLLARPDDLVLVDLGDWRSSMRGERIAGRLRDGRLVPYESRAGIEAGAIAEKAEPLVWLDDPVDAFFLHIQGSGRVRLDDGSVLRVGYDGHNGHVYYPVGRYLIESGEIAREEISLQTIRAWLYANPERMHEVMNRNPSYIFFRTIEGEGPIGAQGVALTAGRSLAVDRRYIPLGAPVWIDIDYRDEAGQPLRRLVVAQDTGGAIRGAVRGDVFWGHGEQAAELAGPMAAGGRYFVLLPKNMDIALSR